MTPRAMVAGIGNVFLGDDGFGPEVARRLGADGLGLPGDVSVRDVGIGILHLAFALLDPPELLLLIDATDRGAAPGTLFLIEPDLSRLAHDAVPDAHALTASSVLASVRALGGALPRVLLIGCQPACLDEELGLSPVVEQAVPGAMTLVRDVLQRELKPPRPAGPSAPMKEDPS